MRSLLIAILCIFFCNRFRERRYFMDKSKYLVASANCAIYCNAKVDFVDIDPDTFNICTNALEKKLIEAERENNLPKAIVPVHFGGLSCDMEHIYRLSIKYGFKIIEDATCHWKYYKGHPVGPANLVILQFLVFIL